MNIDSIRIVKDSVIVPSSRETQAMLASGVDDWWQGLDLKQRLTAHLLMTVED